MSLTKTTIQLNTLPGHLIRLLHQRAESLFHQEMGDLDITPPQFSCLLTINDNPGIDQKSVAKSIGLDVSTLGGVINRLEKRNLVKRSISTSDRRAHTLIITEFGEAVLAAAIPRVMNAQKYFLIALSSTEQNKFLTTAKKLLFNSLYEPIQEHHLREKSETTDKPMPEPTISP